MTWERQIADYEAQHNKKPGDDMKRAINVGSGAHGVKAAHGHLCAIVAYAAYVSIDARASDELLGIATGLYSDEGSGKRNQSDDVEVDAVQFKGWGKKGSGKKS